MLGKKSFMLLDFFNFSFFFEQIFANWYFFRNFATRKNKLWKNCNLVQ